MIQFKLADPACTWLEWEAKKLGTTVPALVRSIMMLGWRRSLEGTRQPKAPPRRPRPARATQRQGAR